MIDESKGDKKLDLTTKLQEILHNEKYTKIIIVVGLVGIAVIFLSGFLPSCSSAKESKGNVILTSDTSAFQQSLENKLTDMLSAIDGAGKTKVMVTVESSAELVYAKDDKLTTDSDNTKSNSTAQNNYITVKLADGTQQTVLLKEIQPKVRGVLVLCSGGENKIIHQRVLDAVSKSLNISSAKICVTKLSQ